MNHAPTYPNKESVLLLFIDGTLLLMTSYDKYQFVFLTVSLCQFHYQCLPFMNMNNG